MDWFLQTFQREILRKRRKNNLQQSLNKAFWSHFKYFEWLLGKIYLFLTPRAEKKKKFVCKKRKLAFCENLKRWGNVTSKILFRGTLASFSFLKLWLKRKPIMTLFSHLPMDHNEVLRCQIVAKRKKRFAVLADSVRRVAMHLRNSSSSPYVFSCFHLKTSITIVLLIWYFIQERCC